MRDRAIIPDAPAERNLGDALLEMGWLLAALLVPLAVNLWARQPFDLPKAALLRTLAWLVGGLWLANGLLARRSPWRELQRNPLLWPALAVAATQILSTTFAADRGLSLWGSYERAQGLLTLLSYVLLFLVVAARLQTVDRAQRLAGTLVASGAPLVVLGLAQALGWQPLDLVTDARSPVFAALGRSNFLGATLALLLPPTAILALTARQKWQQAAGLALLLGELAVIALTRARGAWLAAAVALAALALLWAWPRLAVLGRWRWALPAGGGTALAGGLSLVLWLGREGGSEAARLTIWQATLDLIARRPLLGYGPEGLGLVFPGVYPPQLVYYQGRGQVVDRAHNLFLDGAASSGLLGLLAGLALLVAVFAVGWQAASRATDPARRGLLLACLAALAGSVAGNLVSFDVTATATATWLLVAVVAALAARGGAGEISPSPQPPPPREGEQLPSLGGGAGGGKDRLPPNSVSTGERWLRPVAAALLLIGVLAAIVQFNIRPLAADVAAQTADRRAAAGDWAGAIDAQEQAVRLWPAEPVHHQALSWVYLQQALCDEPQPWLARAEAALLAARDLRPGDYRIWAALGELYGLWGNRWDPGQLPLAHDAYRQATVMAPNHAILYTAWGMVDLEGNRFAEAAGRFRQATNLDATDGYAFAHLGDAELAQGHVEAALAAYQQAVHWEPELIPAHVGLAASYWQLGQTDAARRALAQALELDPDNEDAQRLKRQLGLAP